MLPRAKSVINLNAWHYVRKIERQNFQIFIPFSEINLSLDEDKMNCVSQQMFDLQI